MFLFVCAGVTVSRAVTVETYQASVVKHQLTVDTRCFCGTESRSAIGSILYVRFGQLLASAPSGLNDF